MKLSRPQSIIWFERFFFASLAVSFIDMFVHRDGLLTDDEMVGDAGLIFMLVMAGSVVLSFGIQILLWFFVTYRARNWAKWAYIVLCILGLVALVSFIFEYSVSELVFLVVTQLLALGSIICLFTPEARLWFQSKGLISKGKSDGLSDVFR